MSILSTVIDRRAVAVEEVSKALDGNPAFERVSMQELQDTEKGHLAGWRTVEVIEEVGQALEFYLPPFFPDHPPEVFLSSNAADWYLKSPHVEQDGRICTLPDSAAIDASAPVELVGECLRRAVEVLTNVSEDEFRDEALIYWSLSGGSHQYKAYSCSSLTSILERCVIGVSGKVIIVAGDAASAQEWLGNWKGKRAKLDFCAPCIVVETNAVLLPQQYPNSYSDVRSLLSQHAPEALSAYDEYTCKTSKLFGVVFIQDTPEGKILAGVVAHGKGLDRKSKLIHGFRPDQAPAALLRRRSGGLFDLGKIKTVGITRTDSDWIHSRGGFGPSLQGKKVVLIGCGSLGGYVSHLLARAGVGSLSLLDNDILSWANVGRHILGATDVGRSKSEAMAQKLSSELPHLDISHFSGDWRDWVQTPEGEGRFLGADLIVSTVADWRCERPLNLAIRELGGIDAIYAWLEPFGVSAQVLISRDQGGCLECGMDSLGKFQDRVVDFKEGTLRKEPGGCAYYQQYGPTKIVPLAGLIVDAAIQSLCADSGGGSELWTIIGELSDLGELGGTLREPYLPHDRNELSTTLRREWHRISDCSCCNK